MHLTYYAILHKTCVGQQRVKIFRKLLEIRSHLEHSLEEDAAVQHLAHHSPHRRRGGEERAPIPLAGEGRGVLTQGREDGSGHFPKETHALTSFDTTRQHTPHTIFEKGGHKYLLPYKGKMWKENLEEKKDLFFEKILD
jgi:hypothetical protein